MGLRQEPPPSRATTGGKERQRLSASHSMERCMGGCLLLLLVSLITPMLAQEYQCDPTPNGLSDNCIGCICEVSTRCNATTKCISGGSFCGPFLLSKPFWVDGGSCVLEGDSPGDQGAWRRCALDIICSANTIRSYINRFGKDCNGDALVTCEDYTMIHKVCSPSFSSYGEPLIPLPCSPRSSSTSRLTNPTNHPHLHLPQTFTFQNGGWNCGTSLVGSNFWDIFQTCKDTVIGRGLNI